jgi:chromosome segregation ATPase
VSERVEVKVRDLTEKIQDFKRKLTNFNSDLVALEAQLPLKHANLEEQKKRTKEAAISLEILKEKESLVQKATRDYQGLLEPCQEAGEAAANVAGKVNELYVNKKKKITENLDKLTNTRKKVVEETNKKRVAITNQKSPTKKLAYNKIMCSCNSYYFGETSRTLSERCKEHIRDVKKLDASKSALAHRISENLNQQFHFDSASLGEIEEGFWLGKFKEILYTQKTKNPINRDNGLSVSPYWSSLMLPLMKNP